MNKIKITLLISSTYGGGAERVTCNLASFLAERGYDIHLLTISETKESYEISSKVHTVSLLPLSERGNSFCNNIRRVIHICSYMRRQKRDVYIVMLPTIIRFFMLFRKLTKSKVIISERADPNSYEKKIQRKMLEYAKKADGMIFQTKDAAEWYEESIQNTLSVVIPNAINPVFLREHYTGIRKKEIVSVGRLSSQKNFSLLIEAFSQIQSRYPEYKLIIYGEGEERGHLEQLVKSKSLTAKIKLPGNVQNIADIIWKSQLFVLPSNFEGMPNSLMEAMALGIPCIATDCPVGGPRFLIKNGENGFLVDVNNIEQLRDCMDKILSENKVAKRIGENAKKIQEILSPEKIYGEWEEFIIKVYEKNKCKNDKFKNASINY